MCYRCGICRDVVLPNKPRKVHRVMRDKAVNYWAQVNGKPELTVRTSREIAAEVPICDECEHCLITESLMRVTASRAPKAGELAAPEYVAGEPALPASGEEALSTMNGKLSPLSITVEIDLYGLFRMYGAAGFWLPKYAKMPPLDVAEQIRPRWKLRKLYERIVHNVTGKRPRRPAPATFGGDYRVVDAAPVETIN